MGLKSPVPEGDELPDVFNVRSMVENSNGPYRHGCREGVS
jgi:hypothetical protein